MINCSIHNYKEWMGPYLDGKLSREDMLAVESFLQQHPTIMDGYLSELEEFSLNPDEDTSPSFKNLEINIIPTTNIREDNFADYFISYHEGILNDKEKIELDQFHQLNPSLQKEFEVYGSTILVADGSIIYKDKHSLLKKTKRPVPMFIRYASVAASVLLMIGIWIFWPQTHSTNALALDNLNKVTIPANKLQDSKINVTNGSIVKNDMNVNNDNNTQIKENKFLIKHHNEPIKVDMGINSPVNIQPALASVDHLSPQMSIQEIKQIIVTDENKLVAESKPRKKGLLNRLFSGEKTYIEDYVNATFTALNNNEENNQWVLKVDRDEEGKSKRVKFSSPIFSAKSRN